MRLRNDGVEATRIAERRHITVLFCDLIGSSQLGAELDPEDFSEVIVAFRRSASAVIEQHGGFVVRYIGDGILACWGYPRGAENDAYRALAAALDLVEHVPPCGRTLPQIQRDLPIRIAIEAGTCVVGAIGDAQIDVVGDAPNTAALLQNHAPPNGIVTTTALKTLTEDTFEFAALGKARLKGALGHIDMHRVVGRKRLWSGRARRDTGLIGRATECATLDTFWAGIVGGTSTSLVISGEAGIGKSCLLSHLQHRALDGGARWLEAFCAPESEQSPLQPLRDILLQDMGLTGLEPREQRAAACAEYIATLGVSDDAEQVLAGFLDFGPDQMERWRPEEFRESLFHALFAIIAHHAERAPLVVVIEDAHWSDPTSREFLDRLERDHLPQGCGIVLTSRERPGPGSVPRPGRTRIDLERLDDDAIAEIFRSEVGPDEVDPAMLHNLVEQCDGVPFYASQVAQLVREAGFSAAAANLSGALSAWLTARLDTAAEYKDLLQVASVVGRTFHAFLVAAVAKNLREPLEIALARLDEQGFVKQVPPTPAGTHAFRHMLLRETAYHTMLRSRLRQLHGRVAEALVKELPSLATQRPEVVAGHFEAGGRALDAFVWWARAGDRSVAQGATREAKEAYARALEAIGNVEIPEGMRERELAVRASYIMQISLLEGASGLNLREACHELQRRSAAYGEPAPLHSFRAEWVLNFHHVNRAEIHEALPHAENLLQLARRMGAPGLSMQAHRFAALSHLFAGHVERAIAHYEAALAAHDPERDKEHRFEFGSEPGVVIRAQLALALTLSDRPGQAGTIDAEALALAQHTGHPHSLVHALSFSATRLALAGELDTAASRVRDAMSVCGTRGFAYWAAWNDITTALIDVRRAPDTVDLARLQDVERHYGGFGARQGLALLDLAMGEWLVRSEAFEAARDHLEKAIASWRSPGLRLFEPLMRALKARAEFDLVGDTEAFAAERDDILRSTKLHISVLRADVERILSAPVRPGPSGAA